MLIDDLIHAPVIDNCSPEGQARLQRIFPAAKKYELGPDFAAAAEELSTNFSGIVKALPFCRVPFPLMWIEVAQEHRPRFSAAPMHMPGIQHHVRRVGFLIKEHEDHSFTAFLFWVLANREAPPQASFMSTRFSPANAKDVPEDAKPPAMPPEEEDDPSLPTAKGWLNATPYVQAVMVACIEPGVPNFVDPNIYHPQVMGFAMKAGRSDWSGEAAYLLATLALINTVNVTETHQIDNSKLNKARARSGKPPLSDRSVIVISPRIKKRIIGGESTAGGYKLLTGQLVSGHWKVRKTGVFYWNFHSRGPKGTAPDKRYLVK